MNPLRLLVAVCVGSLLTLLVVSMVGCSASNQRNDLLVDIAVSQGVVRFVEAGATAAEDAKRREDLIAALSVARQFVHTDQPVSADHWADQFILLMDWDALSVSDQMLLAQVLELVRVELERRTAGSDDVKIYLRRVVDVAINTAAHL